MSVPVRCLLCKRDFSSTEKFVLHYERTHFEVSGTHEREYEERGTRYDDPFEGCREDEDHRGYLDHLTQEHLEDAK